MSCPYCAGNGWLYALAYDSMAEMTFICSFCQAAKRRGIVEGKGARAWRKDDALGFFLLDAKTPRPTPEQLRARSMG